MAGQYNRRMVLADLFGKGLSKGADAAQAQMQRSGNMSTLDELLGRFPKGRVSVSGDGNASVDTESNDLMKMLQMKMMMDERNEKAVEGMGKRVESADIPGTVSQLKNVQAALPPDGTPMKSVGPLKNAIPNALVPGLEFAGLLDKGAAQERQALEAAKGLVRKPLYGTALTPQEKESFDTAFGAPLGGNEEQVRAAIKRMADIPREQMTNIESSTRPEAVKTYRDRGGITMKSLDQLLKPPTSTPPGGGTGGGLPGATDSMAGQEDARVQRLQQLRAKYKR